MASFRSTAYLRRPPEELNNLADDPDHRRKLHELRARTDAWQRATDDAWLYRDGISVRAIARHLEAGWTCPRFDLDPDEPGNR